MMKVIKLMYVLYKIKSLSPISVIQLIQSIYKNGMNLMTLLSFATKKYTHRIALVDDNETISYQKLFEDSNKLVVCLRNQVQLKSGKKIAFLCKNHASLVKSIFAASRLGAELFFLNTELSKNQFNEIHNDHMFDFLIYDDEFTHLVKESNFQNTKILSYHDYLPAINNFLYFGELEKEYHIPRTSNSKLTLFTSGTTGIPKRAVHKPTLLNYLNPFVSFITRLKVLNYDNAYIATPVYHGYGMAILLLFIPLGKKIIIQRKFDAVEACQLIQRHQVEVVTVVPTMLQRLLDSNDDQLNSLKCIASGGAKLSTKLVNETQNKLGFVLYNLYGTSEAGLNFIATPEDLNYSHTTIGKKISGMHLKILDSNMKEVENGKIGQFCIKNDWSIQNKKNCWIETGDLGYQDEHGFYFLSSRIDDMVISGGVNVYPQEIEQMLMKHPDILDAAVIGIDDEEFGQRLKAYVLPIMNTTITEKVIHEWLRSRVSRFQLPKEIEFIYQLPYTSLGKLDRKQLNK